MNQEKKAFTLSPVCLVLLLSFGIGLLLVGKTSTTVSMGELDEFNAPENITSLIKSLREDIETIGGRSVYKKASAVNWEVNDDMLMRYLHVADFQLHYKGKPLAEHFHETLEWRRSFRACCLSTPDVQQYLEKPVVYVNGYDRLDRPILYFQLGISEKLEVHSMETLTVYTIERARKMMKNASQQRVMVVIDCAGIIFFPPVSHIIQIFQTLSRNYPWRLGRIVVFNANYPVRALWKIASAILRKRTLRKIFFAETHPSDPNNSKQLILETVAPENLERRYGGSSQFVYDKEKYLLGYKPQTKCSC